MYYHHGNVFLHTVGTYTDKKPTMTQLQYMEYRDEEGKEIEVRIIDQVEAKWTKLVHALELPPVTVANEMAISGWTPDSACSNVLFAWLSGEGAEPHTWATVLKALKRVGGYREFIKQVELALAEEYGNVTQDSKKPDSTPDITQGELHSRVLSSPKHIT